MCHGDGYFVKKELVRTVLAAVARARTVHKYFHRHIID